MQELRTATLALGICACACFVISAGDSAWWKLLGAGLGAALWALIDARRLAVTPALALGLSLWLLPLLIASVYALMPWYSLSGSLARGQGLLASLIGAAVLALAASVRGDWWRSLLRGLPLLALPLLGIVLWQVIGGGAAWTGAEAARPAATLGNATALGGLALLLVPLAVQQRRARHGAWMASLTLLAWLALLLLSGTRSAWLSLALVAGLAWVWHGGRCRLGLFFAGLALATALLLMWRPASVAARAALWPAAVEAVLAAPVLVDRQGQADPQHALRWAIGYGPDQGGIALDAVVAAQREATAPFERADRAHQWLLDRALSSGVLGVLGLLIAAALLLRRLHRCRAQLVQDAEWRALGLGLAAYALHLQVAVAFVGEALIAALLLGLWLRPLLGAETATASLPVHSTAYRIGALAFAITVLAALWPFAHTPGWQVARQAEDGWRAADMAWARAASLPDAQAAHQAFVDAARAYDQVCRHEPWSGECSLAVAACLAEAGVRGPIDHAALAAALRHARSMLGDIQRVRQVEARASVVHK